MSTNVVGVLVFITLNVVLFWILYGLMIRLFGQKTRSSQQRRVCVGPRTRQLSVQEPSIYVSPANLPPPPKYEAMAPPSYEEVVGVHYPGYQSQPITQPITHALSTAQSSSSADQNTTITTTCETTPAPTPAPAPAIITVTTEQRRNSATARS